MRNCLRQRLLLSQTNFEKFRPQFAGHEQPPIRFVIGNAVKDRLLVMNFARRKESGLRIDTSDAVSVPNVCVDFPLNIFELVNLLDWRGSINHCDRFSDLEVVRVEKSYA